MLLAETISPNAVTIACIVAGALVAFWLIHKIVRFLLALLIAAVLAAAAVFYAVQAGYLSRETAEKINPLSNAEVRKAVRDAGSWAGNKAKEAAQKAVDGAIGAAVGGSAATNATARERDGF